MTKIGYIHRHSNLDENIDATFEISYSESEYKGYIDKKGFVYLGRLDENQKECIGKLDIKNGKVYYNSSLLKDIVDLDSDEFGFISMYDGNIHIRHSNREEESIGFIVPLSYTGTVGELHIGSRESSPYYKYSPARTEELKELEMRLFFAGGAALLLFYANHPDLLSY